MPHNAFKRPAYTHKWGYRIVSMPIVLQHHKTFYHEEHLYLFQTWRMLAFIAGWYNCDEQLCNNANSIRC
jgi:hypothetical protein